MTSGLVLDEFNLDLSPSGLLVGFGLVIVVVVVLARLAGVGVVDEAVVCGDGGVVEVVAGALGGHGGGRGVGGLRHGLLGEVVALGVEGRIGRGVWIGRRGLLVWEVWQMLGPAKGHELVKRTAGGGRVGGRAPPIRTRTRNGEEL